MGTDGHKADMSDKDETDKTGMEDMTLEEKMMRERKDGQQEASDTV